MYHGKFSGNQKRYGWLWLLVVLAIMSMGIGGAVAYLSTSSFANNQFLASDAPVLTVDDDYSINVAADYEVYIRAAVVITWQDENGNILAQKPAGAEDCVITYNTEAGWHRDSNNGYWYYPNPVDDKTPPLIASVVFPGSQGNYSCCVEIVAQAIQAIGETDSVPTEAVKDAWG